jgi:hypothetical protein
MPWKSEKGDKSMQKSTVGGILSIVAGALGLVGGLFFIFFSVFFSVLFNDPSIITNSTPPPEQFFMLITILYCAIGVLYIGVGVLSIVGGIFSIQRKHWGWALAGAIGGCLTFLPLGVGAVVLVAMGRAEFNLTSAAPPMRPAVSNQV